MDALHNIFGYTALWTDGHNMHYAVLIDQNKKIGVNGRVTHSRAENNLC